MVVPTLSFPSRWMTAQSAQTPQKHTPRLWDISSSFLSQGTGHMFIPGKTKLGMMDLAPHCSVRDECGTRSINAYFFTASQLDLSCQYIKVYCYATVTSEAWI